MKKFSISILLLVSALAWAAGETKFTQGIIASGPVSVGSVNSAAAGAILDAISTTKVSRPCPSMTTTQQNAIASPLTGGCIYNSSLNRNSVYNGTAWSPEGDVLGAVSSHASAVVVFGGTDGKSIAEAACTQHNLLTCGANNSLSSVAPSSAGKHAISDGTDWTSSYGSYASKSSNYTATASDDTIIGTADLTLSLPAASTVTGKIYHVISSGTATDVIIDPSSTETICGKTTIQVDGDGDSIDIVSDGSNWQALNYGCQREIQDYGNSGSTSITAQQGNCVSSHTNPGAGRSAVNFNSACWSSAPYCLCTAAENAASNMVCDVAGVATTSSVEIRNRIGSSGVLTSSDWQMICRGPR